MRKLSKITNNDLITLNSRGEEGTTAELRARVAVLEADLASLKEAINDYDSYVDMLDFSGLVVLRDVLDGKIQQECYAAGLRNECNWVK